MLPKEDCSAGHDLGHRVGDLDSELEEEGGGHLDHVLTEDEESRHPDLERDEAGDWDHLK